MIDVSLVLATSTGGVGQHVRSIAALLTERGHRVRVAGAAATEDLFRFTAAGAMFTPVEISTNLNPLADARAVAALRNALKGTDIVHAHGFRAGLVASLAKRAPVPLVVTWHNQLMATGIKYRILAAAEKAIARRAAITLGASEDLVARALQLGAPDARLAPVAAPTLASPHRDRAAVRAGLGLMADEPLLLSVGRLHPQKDYPTLIKAAATWRDLDPVPMVAIAGDGPARAQLTELITATGAPVRLLGRRSDIADLLAAADIALVTSVWEARQLFAQEALLAGVPLVATAVGGIPGLVGSAAMLVPPNDQPALDQAVRALLADPDRRAELAAAGKQQAVTWPTEADTTTQLEAIYTELLGRVP